MATNGADMMLEWKGTEQMLQRLAEMPRKLHERHLVIAVKYACAPLLQAIRAAAPVESGTLKKHIKLRVGGIKNKLIAWGVVGPARIKIATSARKSGKHKGRMRAIGKKRQNAMNGEEWASVQIRNPARYAHLVEGGRKAVTPKKKVLASGTYVFGTLAKGVAAKPFMKPAFKATKHQMAQRLADYFRKALKMEANT